MGKSLDELTSYFKPLAQELLDKCNELFPTEIIDTGRTFEEQEKKLADGVSWVSRSKHEPQPPEMKSEAIDIAPVHLMKLKNWAPDHPDWTKIGTIGEVLGLRWGGRWIKKDMGHFEYVHRI